MSRKRTLTDIYRPRGKRQLLEAIESLSLSIPLPSPAVISRKRQREDSDEDDQQTKKRTREDPDDNGQLSLEQAADSPQPSLNQKHRMSIYKSLHTFKTWNECCETLKLIPNENIRMMALAVTDLPEWSRLAALRELREKHHQYREIIKSISELQINKRWNDPGSLFASCFTQEYSNTLLSSARQCYHCNQAFEEGATMVWKSCGKHTMHKKCLKELFEDKSYEPLVGDCPCILEY